MSDEGWISIQEKLPPLNKDVQTLRYLSGIREYEEISDNSLYITQKQNGEYRWFVNFTNNKFFWTHWKGEKCNLKEKRPDFGKLKKGIYRL